MRRLLGRMALLFGKSVHFDASRTFKRDNKLLFSLRTKLIFANFFVVSDENLIAKGVVPGSHVVGRFHLWYLLI